MQSLFSSLNLEQQSAAEDTNHLILVQAGPGTGKTLTLVAKIGWLLEQRVEPKHITAITFTHKAAEEIKTRVQQSFPNHKTHQLNLGTFHSLALQLLPNQDFSLLTEPQQRLVVQKIKTDLQLTEKLKDLISLAGLVKNKPSLLEKLNSKLKKFCRLYQKELETLKKYDFEDLLAKLLKFLEVSDFAKNSYLLVDEFQDVSPLQYQIVASWARQAKQVFLIGDPRQAIYGFRGASADSFTRLTQDFPKVSSHFLTNNYRSAKEILTVASRLYPQDKELQAKKDDTGEVKLISTLNQFTEADWVVADIEQKLGGTGLISASEHHQQTGAGLKDFAVIYRLHQLGATVEQKLKDTGLPFQKAGSDSIYATQEVQFVISLWQLAKLAESDNQDLWLETLSNKSLKISQPTLQKIWQNQEKNKQKLLEQMAAINMLPAKDCQQLRKILDLLKELQKKLEKKSGLTDLLDFTLRQLNFAEDQTDNRSQFRVELMQFADATNPLSSFLKYYDQLKNTDFINEQAEKISLLTMHSAKGLEFDWVYLIGFESGMVPFHKKQKCLLPETETQDEERNLLYVALTRAKKGLYLLSAQKRWRKKQKVSEFLSELSGEYLEQEIDEQTLKIEKKREKAEDKKRQGLLF